MFDQPPDRNSERIVTGVISTGVGCGVAVFAGAMVVVAVIVLAGLLRHMQWARRLPFDEGLAWAGISVGMPLGVVCGVAAFIIAYR